jgi:hypothetical protein
MNCTTCITHATQFVVVISPFLDCWKICPLTLLNFYKSFLSYSFAAKRMMLSHLKSNLVVLATVRLSNFLQLSGPLIMLMSLILLILASPFHRNLAQN